MRLESLGVQYNIIIIPGRKIHYIKVVRHFLTGTECREWGGISILYHPTYIYIVGVQCQEESVVWYPAL